MIVQTIIVEGTQEFHGWDVEWKAKVRLSYLPAKLYGPPEHCHEAESDAEIEELETWPGYEDKINEDLVIEKAWEKFDQETAAADMADHADFINDSLQDR